MPYLTGQKLKEEVNRPLLGCSPMIEEYLFEDTVTMYSSQPGVGKSVVTTNEMAYTSCGAKVFGFLNSHGSYKSVYLQMEGSRDEQLSRLKSMEEVIPINYDNISWHNTPIIAEDTKTWDVLFQELAEVAPFHKLYMDPIYKATMYGLKKEESVLALIKLLDKIRAEFRPAIILNNHETKQSYNYKGDPIEKDDPFYGSQWLKAYVDVSFNIQPSEKNMVEIIQKKDRTNNILKKFVLNFDASNFTLKFNQIGSDLPARHRVQMFLQKKFDNNSFATTGEIARELDITKRHILRMKQDAYFDHFVFFDDKGKETVWRKKVG